MAKTDIFVPPWLSNNDFISSLLGARGGGIYFRKWMSALSPIHHIRF